MNNILKIFVFITLVGFFWNGCSSSIPEVKEISKVSKDIYSDSLRINTKDIYAWVNKMPGQKARFHVTGKLQLFDNPEYDVNELMIKNISVIQDNMIIYQFNPKVENEYKENYKSIIFSTIRGLLLSSIVDTKKEISLKIKLSDSSKDYFYKIDKISIAEVF